MKKIIILALVVLLFSNCSDDTPQEAWPQNVSSTQLGKGERTSSDPGYLPGLKTSITNNDQWQNFLSEFSYNDNMVTNLTGTTIDFAEEQVIVVIDIVRSYSGNSITIESIKENEQNIMVKTKTQTMGVMAAVSIPYHIVKIPASTKPVLFN